MPHSHSTSIYSWLSAPTESVFPRLIFTRLSAPKMASHFKCHLTLTWTGGPSLYSTSMSYWRCQDSCQPIIWFRAATKSSRSLCALAVWSEVFSPVKICMILWLCHQIWDSSFPSILASGLSSLHGSNFHQISRLMQMMNSYNCKESSRLKHVQLSSAKTKEMHFLTAKKTKWSRRFLKCSTLRDKHTSTQLK